jgi:AraC family transcriptional regulator of adaptative response/methylated-DNA-[protein]-cysteine methyltransferase
VLAPAQAERDSHRTRSTHADDARWAAVLARDGACDGTFLYSVATTGVYCRPSCPSRRPKRENVRFHATQAEAEAAGFRACLRCRPDSAGQAERHAAIVEQACRLIASAPEQPALAEIASAVGLSPHHFHRVFKSVAGVTPKAYAGAVRRARLVESLQAGRFVTEAIYEAGFGSTGRFYEGAKDALGMAPSRYRRRGERETIRYAIAPCSLGKVLIAASDTGVAAILLGDDDSALKRELHDRFAKADLVAGGPEFEGLVEKVVVFVDAKSPRLDLPLDVRGTAFQQLVWAALRAIKPGSTATYAEVAEQIGKPGAVRAVAAACAANPVAVAIPCHRVIRQGGALAGYRWGLKRKEAILAREARAKPAKG